jgi:StAR-related lipid transfer protein 10
MPKPAKYKCPFNFSGASFEHEDMVYTLATKEDCLKFRNFADSDAGFELRFDNKKILVWDKKVDGESMRIVKTFSIFEDCPPQRLWDLLQESVYRLDWDVNCKKCKTVVRMDARNDICYYASKAPPGISDRDVVCQRAWHMAGNGEYVILNTSVKHKSCPEKMKYTRAWSFLSGYLIRPHGNNSSSLVFISQTDPKGLIPSKIINYVTQKFVPDTVETLQRAAKGFPEWLAKQKTFVRDWDIPEESWGVSVPSVTLDIVQERWFSGHVVDPPATLDGDVFSPTTSAPIEEKASVPDDVDDDTPAPVQIDEDDL